MRYRSNDRRQHHEATRAKWDRRRQRTELYWFFTRQVSPFAAYLILLAAAFYLVSEAIS